ncbi:MAG: PilZ domain-containing protein [Hyphomicrobiaceae bacterium]
MHYRPNAAQLPTSDLRAPPDRRRHPRVEIALTGRLMRADGSEHPCLTRDISIGGVALYTAATLRPGEKIIAYIDDVGRIEGQVYRLLKDGFAITIAASERRREKLAAQLMWLLNRDDSGADSGRRVGHDRYVPEDNSGTLHFDDGTTMPCMVLDVSISGASVGCQHRPEIGTVLRLGEVFGRVVRYHDEGFAIEFVDVLDPDILRSRFGI